MDMQELINKMFRHLSKRLGKENDLSDITWCMMSIMPEFARKLLEFMDVPFPADEKMEECIREYVFERSGSSTNTNQRDQIDFLIKTGKGSILLENKIWDTNYHFDQYNKAINDDPTLKAADHYKRLISAHRLSQTNVNQGVDAGFKIFYWEDLINSLTGKLNDFNSEEKTLVIGYKEYIKEVIKMTEIGEIRLDDRVLKSLLYVNNLIEKIIKLHPGDGRKFTYAPYTNKNRSFGNAHSGHGYSIHCVTNNKSAWLLFYFQYYTYSFTTDGKPAFIIDLQIDWNSDLVKRMKKLTRENNDLFSVLSDNEGLAFVMKPDIYEDFKSLDKDGQEEYLFSFFDAVNKVIEEYLE